MKRVFETPHPDNRKVDRRRYSRRYEQGITGRYVHGSLDHVQGGGGGPDGSVDVVDQPVLLQYPGRLHRLLDADAAVEQLVAAQPHSQHRFPPYGLAHGRDDAAQEPQPIVDGSAVTVGAAVDRPGQELADDGGMRALQLHPVEPPLDTPAGDQRVAGRDFVYLRLAHRHRRLAEQGVGHRRRRPDRQAGIHPAALPPVVIDLGQNGNALIVNPIGYEPVTVQHLRLEGVDHFFVGPVGGMGGVLFGDDQPHSAAGPCFVIGGVLLAGQSVYRIVGQMGGEHNPVVEPKRTYLQRREQSAQPGHRDSISSTARRPSSTASATVRGATQSPARTALLQASGIGAGSRWSASTSAAAASTSVRSE